MSTELDLTRYKDALNIAKTGVDSKGNHYTQLGMLNQAAWLGENAGPLIAEIERLRRLVLVSNSATDRSRGPGRKSARLD